MPKPERARTEFLRQGRSMVHSPIPDCAAATHPKPAYYVNDAPPFRPLTIYLDDKLSEMLRTDRKASDAIMENMEAHLYPPLDAQYSKSMRLEFCLANGRETERFHCDFDGYDGPPISRPDSRRFPHIDDELVPDIVQWHVHPRDPMAPGCPLVTLDLGPFPLSPEEYWADPGYWRMQYKKRRGESFCFFRNALPFCDPAWWNEMFDGTLSERHANDLALWADKWDPNWHVSREKENDAQRSETLRLNLLACHANYRGLPIERTDLGFVFFSYPELGRDKTKTVHWRRYWNLSESDAIQKAEQWSTINQLRRRDHKHCNLYREHRSQYRARKRPEVDYFYASRIHAYLRQDITVVEDVFVSKREAVTAGTPLIRTSDGIQRSPASGNIYVVCVRPGDRLHHLGMIALLSWRTDDEPDRPQYSVSKYCFIASPDDFRVESSGNFTTDDVLFWTSLGMDATLAADLVEAYPRYHRRIGYPRSHAKSAALVARRGLVRRLLSTDDFNECHPAFWFHEGCTWKNATTHAIVTLQNRSPTTVNTSDTQPLNQRPFDPTNFDVKWYRRFNKS